MCACSLSASMCTLCVCEWKPNVLCVKELPAVFLCRVKKKRETETLPKVLKLVSSYRGTMAIAGDRSSLLSGLFSPPLCFALTKGLWV